MVRSAGLFAGGVALAWAAGFAWFVVDATRPPPPSAPRADGIVALTGGMDRIPTALRLLADNAAPKLLLSGVGRGVALREVGRASGIDTDALAARITVGHAAEDTRGNAGETASWATDQGVRSLLVVTSGYHMRRALLELRRAVPEIALYPVRVHPQAADPKLYAAEFTKLLVACAQPSGSLQTGVWGMWTSLWGTPADRSPAPANNPSNRLTSMIFFARGGAI